MYLCSRPVQLLLKTTRGLERGLGNLPGFSERHQRRSSFHGLERVWRVRAGRPRGRTRFRDAVRAGFPRHAPSGRSFGSPEAWRAILRGSGCWDGFSGSRRRVLHVSWRWMGWVGFGDLHPASIRTRSGLNRRRGEKRCRNTPKNVSAFPAFSLS